MTTVGREFPEANKKENDKTLQKFNSQNPDCTKRKLKLQSKEHDLQRKASGEKALSLY